MYESFYRLSTKPFGLNPDPDFIFTRRGHELAMAHLRYGISQSTGFVVITGAPGTGKTTLARALLKELANNTTIVVAHLPSTHLAADDLLRVVADSLGLKYEGLSKPEILKLLNNFLLTCIRERKRTLLVIDEAQNLPACAFEELRLLANLRLGAKALLQTILLGQEQFRQMLNTQEFSQIMQRVVANYHLVPLTLEETQAYIESRLIHANWQGNPHFSDEAIFCIHEYTEGIPRRINKFCERLLLYGYLEEQTEISREIAQVVINEFQQETPISKRRAEDIEIDETALAEPLTVPYEEKEHSDKEIADESQYEEYSSSLNTQDDHNIDDETKTVPTVQSPDIEIKEESQAVIENFEDKFQDKETAEEKLPDKADKNASIASEQEAFALMTEGLGSTNSEPEIAVEELNSDDSEKSSIDTNELDLQSAAIESEENTAVAMASSAQHKLDINEVLPLSGRTKFRVIDGGKESDTSTITKIKKNQNRLSQDKDVDHRILKLVLAFQLSPKHFENLTNPEKQLPNNDAIRLLEFATASDNNITAVLPKSLRGISQHNLQTAINFYIWEVILKPEGDDYRTLGLKNNTPIEEIRPHYKRLKIFLKNQQREHKDAAKYLSRIDSAYKNLTNETGDDSEIVKLPTASTLKQKDSFELDKIEEAYEILSEEAVASAKPSENSFNKKGNKDGSNKYTKYLIVGLVSVAIGIGFYKTQPNTADTITTDSSDVDHLKKPAIFGTTDTKQTTTEVLEENITDIDAYSPDIDVAADTYFQEDTDNMLSDNEFSLLDDDPWSEYSEISEPIDENPVSVTQQTADETPDIKTTIKPEPELTQSTTEQRTVTYKKPVLPANNDNIINKVASAPIVTNTAKSIPLATTYPQTDAKKPVTIDNNIEKVDLINLISNFTSAYESGDINRFMKLFAIDATSFDGSSYSDINDIEADYTDLFNTTDVRQIAIKNIVWNTNYNISEGTSDFVATVKNSDAKHFEFISGIITFDVEKTPAGTFITQLSYQINK